MKLLYVPVAICVFVYLQTEGAIPLGPTGEVTVAETHLAAHVEVTAMPQCK
jgi:hypothetical protein